MSSFIKGLELDLYDFDGKLVIVSEEHGADANFCLSCFMWQAFSKPENGVFLFSLHHSLRHYYHVGMRLGYNLSTHIGKRFIALDALDITQPNATKSDCDLSDPMNVLTLIKNQVDILKQQCKNIFIVIDDLSDFLNLGAPVKKVILFVQQLKLILSAGLSLIICTHNTVGDIDQEILKNYMAHIADLRLEVNPLETGFSKEVTGSIQVNKRNKDLVEGWSTFSLYHFKTGERTVKVFHPGNISFSY